MKKLIGALVGGLLLLLIALAALPFVIQVDKYRPEITRIANESLNGKLTLGKLSLSLWGSIRVAIDGMELRDAADQEVVLAKDLSLVLPWSSVFSGSPEATLHLKAPSLTVVKDGAGKLNLLGLVKRENAAPPAEATGSSSATAPALPALLTQARMGVYLEKALLRYSDKKSATEAELRDLDIKIRDLSLGREMDVFVSAQVNSKLGKSVTIQGPITLSMQGKPTMSEGKLTEFLLKFKAQAADLEVEQAGVFHKAKGIPAVMEGSLRLLGEELELIGCQMGFHNAQVSVEGKVAPVSGDAAPLDLKFKSNKIAFAPWKELLPALKAHELSGNGEIEGVVLGTSAAPKYDIHLRALDLVAKAPNLKASPIWNASAHIVPDEVKAIVATMKAPGNQLRISGGVQSFTRPKLQLMVQSDGLDLDQLIEFPKPANGKSAKSSGGGGANSTATETTDLDALLAPLRGNATAAATTATLQVNLKFVKAQNVKMQDITAKGSLRNLALTVEPFAFNLWNGKVKANAQMQLAPAQPTYAISVDVQNLDLRQAVTSQMELFKNTLQGVMTLSFSGQGRSLNEATAKQHLQAKGMVKVVDAVFATIDIGKMATEALNKSLGGIAAKVPGFQGKGLNPPNNVESKYESVTSDIIIEKGAFKAPNFFAKALPQRGLDLRGATQVGLVDHTVSANWEVIDTYNLTTARNLGADISGTHIPHLLAEGDSPVRFPVSVSGNVGDPQVNYAGVVEALAKVAGNNVVKAAEAKLKAEAEKKANEAVKSAVQGLGKKLFGK